ncbi:hypothetical protein [Bradyrhizobium sp. S69]|uniref:hypothetical protein n=1 Tax=Bradyrhizobium sp. S69 TaxID=1641856 RepID=UPI00131A6CBB|nr:hypothetical protein [Bradyrhizobium sp. S69]
MFEFLHLSDFWPYIPTATASFLGAGVAAWFALNRFYREKIWERKAAAYTAIFEALHFIDNWYSKHYDAYLTRRELSKEETDKLRAAANDAEAELERRLASETWLIPNNCRLRLKKLTTGLKEREEDWFEYLEAGQAKLQTATDELREMVHADLHLYSPPRLALSRLLRILRERRERKKRLSWQPPNVH